MQTLVSLFFLFISSLPPLAEAAAAAAATPGHLNSRRLTQVEGDLRAECSVELDYTVNLGNGDLVSLMPIFLSTVAIRNNGQVGIHGNGEGEGCALRRALRLKSHPITSTIPRKIPLL